MPKSGIFVGFERLKIEKNKAEKSIRDANTGGKIMQTTFYPLVLYNRVEKDFRYTFIGGKWIMDSLNITPGKSSKTTIYEPAINLILVN
jgi:hypothetical protein